MAFIMDCFSKVEKREPAMEGVDFSQSRPHPAPRPAVIASEGIFSITFNTNDEVLSEADLQECFSEVKGAAIVACSFQEYDLAPAVMVPAQPLIFVDADTAATEASDTEAYLRMRGGGSAANDTKDAARLALMLAVLGDGYELVADVAMGEPAGLCKPSPKPFAAAEAAEGGKKDKKKEKLEWYGFIRLVVFAKVGSFAGGRLAAPRSVVIPCGTKVCGNPTSDWPAPEAEAAEAVEATASARAAPYAEERSPDKGAVGVYFPAARLLVVSAHLHGTNEHGVPEEHFNAVRRRQVGRISEGLAWLLGFAGGAKRAVLDLAELSSCALVVAGDLNFRVESAYTSPAEKAQGGADFAWVEAIASAGSAAELGGLFSGHDHLHRWLSGSGPEPCPLLFEGCVDAVGEAVTRGKAHLRSEDTAPQLLRPTFTYGPGKPFPRKFKDKRTPSWTDRILARNLDVALGCAELPAGEHRGCLAECRSLPLVVCSDHEAVVARFEA